MKARMQAFVERAPFRQVFLFFLTFFGLHALLTMALSTLIEAFGLNGMVLKDLLNENELAIQLSCLISANYVSQVDLKGPRFLTSFSPTKFRAGLLRGFLVASLGVALS